jgi:hypothetical protein
MDPRVELFDGYVSREPEIRLASDLSAAELETDPDAIARGMAQDMFAIFNWSDAQESMIAEWQQRLLSRRF